MLWAHVAKSVPLGKWKNVKIEGKRLVGIASFETVLTDPPTANRYGISMIRSTTSPSCSVVVLVVPTINFIECFLVGFILDRFEPKILQPSVGELIPAAGKYKSGAARLNKVEQLEPPADPN